MPPVFITGDCTILRRRSCDMVPSFTQNANCLLQVVASDEHMVGVVRRDREYADAGRRERCRQPGQYTDHLQVQGAANRQHRPRPIGQDARGNNTRVAYDGQFRRRTRDREERSLRDPGWQPIVGRQATERVRARDYVEREWCRQQRGYRADPKTNPIDRSMGLYDVPKSGAVMLF